MKLTFHGGAKSVTGSNYLLEINRPTKVKILIDCGLSQGSRYAERQNFEPFPYSPAEISAVFITHAHIDHIGRLPKLYRDGFRGKVFSTPATRGFAELLLLDSEHILSEEAEKEGKPPIYSTEDISELMKLWEGVDYHKPLDWHGARIEFFDAGHILGSSFIKIDAEDKSIVFSGDLGNYPAPVIKSTEKLPEVDYCLVESVYGDRVHGNSDESEGVLEDTIEDTVKSGGVLMIPAFAMERTQKLLYELNALVENGRIPKIPIFIDSPLAIKLTTVYKEYERYFNKEASKLVTSGDDIMDFPGLNATLTTEESKGINDVPPPKVIIAGAGMSQGGRIIHHEKRYLPDPSSTILFVGYQTAGSMGRQILEGAETVKIFGEEIPVRCRVVSVSGYSAHADQKKLIDWIRPARLTLKKVFVVQGEEKSSEVLASKIEDELAVNVEVPEPGSQIEL